MVLVGELAHIEVAPAEAQGLRNDPLLVSHADTGQVKVQPIATGLLGGSRDETESYLSAVSRQESTAGLVDDLPVEQAAPNEATPSGSWASKVTATSEEGIRARWTRRGIPAMQFPASARRGEPRRVASDRREPVGPRVSRRSTESAMGRARKPGLGDPPDRARPFVGGSPAHRPIIQSVGHRFSGYRDMTSGRAGRCSTRHTRSGMIQ